LFLNHLNEKDKKHMEGKDKKGRRFPDMVGKQNGRGRGLITESRQVMTFLQ
jgi:hypothetical protein